MKNLMIFINPAKKFFGEPETLIRIQIDNSLDLGWKKEDIILATNFDFEYNGVKSIVVKDENFVPFYIQGSKHKTILELKERGFIKENELYWFHDLDAYQSEVISPSEIMMEEADMALTDYGRLKRLNTGSVFFKSSIVDIIEALSKTQNLFKLGDEQALDVLLYGVRENEQKLFNFDTDVLMKIPKVSNISNRIKRINITYNFTYFDLIYCYKTAIKPIKIVHFHPDGAYRALFIHRLLDFYMYGKNELNQVLMSERLIKLFHGHGLK